MYVFGNAGVCLHAVKYSRLIDGSGSEYSEWVSSADLYIYIASSTAFLSVCLEFSTSICHVTRTDECGMPNTCMHPSCHIYECHVVTQSRARYGWECTAMKILTGSVCLLPPRSPRRSSASSAGPFPAILCIFGHVRAFETSWRDDFDSANFYVVSTGNDGKNHEHTHRRRTRESGTHTHGLCSPMMIFVSSWGERT